MLFYHFCFFTVLFANEEACSDNFEDLLQKKALWLVENACLKLRHELDTDAEENALDTDEYLLCRALVELEEIKKEKDTGKRFWIPCVSIHLSTFNFGRFPLRRLDA